jgi:glycosyltransferase involved in cell wall biosynthesis
MLIFKCLESTIIIVVIYMCFLIYYGVMKIMKNILMINRVDSSFIKKDYDLLKSHFNVKLIKSIPKMYSIYYPFWFCFNFIRLLSVAYNSNILYSQWCTSFFTSFLGFITNKKVVLIAGGYDTVGNKKYNYGVFRNFFLSLIVYFNLKNANSILVISKAVKKNLIKKYPSLSDKLILIYRGYDYNYWRSNPSKKRDFFAITVCLNRMDKNYKSTFYIKGIDRYLKVVKKNPSKLFLLIGTSLDVFNKLKIKIPKNLKVIEYCDSKNLKKYYSSTKFYCQFSRYEGFGNSVCEAMLCNCKPIVWKTEGLLEVVGDVGQIISNIKDINWNCCENFYAPRNRIKTVYPISKRNKKLIAFLSKIN